MSPKGKLRARWKRTLFGDHVSTAGYVRQVHGGWRYTVISVTYKHHILWFKGLPTDAPSGFAPTCRQAMLACEKARRKG